MFRPLTVALVLVLCPLASAQSLPPGLIFHATFDGDLQAQFARGDTAATPEGHPQFADGYRGQGLVVGDLDGSAGVKYPVAGNFDLERGTLSLWVQPLNWDGDTRCYRLLFRAWLAQGGQFLLYRNTTADTPLWLYLEPGDAPHGRAWVKAPLRDWQPGQWHHVAVTWCRFEGMAIYVDGELKQHLGQVGGLYGPLQSEMMFGGDWEKKGGRTVIDEAMIFDRMLSPQEIALLADRTDPLPADPRPGDIPGVYLTHAFLGQRILARIWPDCLGEPVQAARLSIRPQGRDEAVAAVDSRLGDSLATMELDITPLAHGPYVARVDLLRDGQMVGGEELAFSKETDDTWQTAATIGRRDTVLPRFQPLRAQEDIITTYAKTCRYAGSGLPAAISAWDQPLLAAPVRVLASTPAGPLAFNPGSLHCAAASDVQAELAGSLVGDGLDVHTRVLARYDGTLWHTLRFAARPGLRLTDLHIEIPLVPAQAEYLCWIAPARVRERWDYGALPQGEGRVWADEFLPALWIGTEDCGLGWYAESDEHWDIEGREALTIERRPEETVLCMNIIRAPRSLQGEFTIEFGLQPTPVRPLLPGWRSAQWLPSADISRFFLGLRRTPFADRGLEGQSPRGKVAYLYTHHQYFTNTLPRDPDEFREMIARAKSYGLYTTPYTEARLLPEAAGDVLTDYEGMLAQPPVRAATYGAVCTAEGCHRGRFGDWLVWYVSHMAKEYGSNGIYLDEMWMTGCSNPAHGCGYVGPDGKRRLTYPLRAANETYRRLRQFFHDRGEPFWLTYHISSGRVPPLPTFGDCLLMLEERYTAVSQNPDYLENTRPDQLRAHSPRAWGIPVVALPQFKMSGDWMKDPQLAHRFMAAVVPHDLMVWPCFADTGEIMRIRDALMAFGIGEADADFLGYWQSDSGISCPDQRVMVSAYTRPGALLLCVTNTTAEPIDALPITLDPGRLGLPLTAATDALTGEELSIRGQTIVLPLPAKSLRLIRVQ